MDQNEVLATIRVCVDDLNGAALSFIERVNASDQLRIAVQALDEWLTHGGDLPDAWQRRAAALSQ